MQVIMGPVMEVVGIAMVQLVRYNEFGADRFAAELGRADHLESALAKLFKVWFLILFKKYSNLTGSGQFKLPALWLALLLASSFTSSL